MWLLRAGCRLWCIDWVEGCGVYQVEEVDGSLVWWLLTESIIWMLWGVVCDWKLCVWWKWDESEMRTELGNIVGVPCLGEQVTHPFRNHVQLHGCLGIMLMVSAMSLGMFHPQSVTFTALKMSDRHACWQNGHISSMWAWIAHPGPGTPREDCRAPLCNDRSVPRCVPAQIIMLE